MRQIYRNTPMLKCDFSKVAYTFTEVAFRHGCSPVDLLHFFGTPVHKNTSRRLLLNHTSFRKSSDLIFSQCYQEYALAQILNIFIFCSELDLFHKKRH